MKLRALGFDPGKLSATALWLAAVLVGAVAAAGDAVLPSEEPGEAESTTLVGEDLYADHCSKCHGKSGRGDGQLAAWLDVPPPDLTVLSRRNGGTFPFTEVLERIDGTREVEGHASSDMPIWGDVFKLRDGDATIEEIAEKLRALTAHVRSLQEPEPQDDQRD